MKQYDLIIIGAGPVGATLALLLAERYKILLLEAQQAPLVTDTRVLALSQRTQQLLSCLEIWPQLQPLPLDAIEVSVQGGILPVYLQEQGPLGYAVPLADLQKVFNETLQSNTTIEQERPARFLGLEKTPHDTWRVSYEKAGHTHCVETKIVVGADGANSAVRQCFPEIKAITGGVKTCLVTQLQLPVSLGATAYQRFSEVGVLALLPDLQGATFVITGSEQQVAAWHNLDLSQKNSLFEKVWGYEPKQWSAFHTFQVTASFVPRSVHDTVVWVGAAAHQLLPIAAQGLNLNLRTVAYLAHCLEKFGVTAVALQAYQTAVNADREQSWKKVQQLAQWSERPSCLAAGLSLMNLVPGLRHLWLDWGKGSGV